MKKITTRMLICAIGLLALPYHAEAGVMDAIGSGLSYVANGVKKAAKDTEKYVTDSFVGQFVLPSERNKRDRERILNVLAYQRAIYYDEQGRPCINNQRMMDEYYEILQKDNLLENIPGFRRKDDPDSRNSQRFWRYFFDGKDRDRGDTPAALDPFENNGLGLATKMHTTLTTFSVDSRAGSSTYSEAAGDLKVRGIDILEQDLRRGVAAGADVYIKALDAITSGASTKAVEWMEDAAQKAKTAADDPTRAAADYVQKKIEERLQSELDKLKEDLSGQAEEVLISKIGKERYEKLMKSYDKYTDKQEKLQKMFEEAARLTGDDRLAEAAKKIGEFAPDAIAEDLAKKYLPNVLKKGDDGDKEKMEDPAAKEEEQAEPQDDADVKTEDKDAKETEPEPKADEPDGTADDSAQKPNDKETPADDEPEPRPEAEDSTAEEPKSEAEPEATEEKETADSAEEDRTDSSSGGKETATDEPDVTDDESENEPEDIPESDDTSMPDETDVPAPDSSSGENTITKGYVEGKDGSRITLTETRDADGNLTRATETETDADGNITSQTTYEGGTGEGRTTPGAPDLRDAEPPSDADVDIGMATGGFKTADDFSSQWTGDQEQRGTDSSLTMAQNTQMEESSNIGNQQIRDARITKDAGGRDARNIRDDSTRNVNKADRENSWGKAIGDAVESGITEGGKAFGQAMGQGAADRVVGDIFGSDEDDSDSSSSGGASASPAPSASAAAPASRSSGSGGKKPSAQTKPSSSSKPSGGAGSAGSTASSDSASSSAPKPETTSSSSAPLVGHCPLCGRTDLVEHVYDTVNMIVHDWRCPVCNVTGRPGPPPPGLGSGSTASSAASTPAPATSTAATPTTGTTTAQPPPPAPKKTRSGCPVCKAPVTTYLNDHYLYGRVYKCANGHFVKGSTLITVEIE